MGTQVNAVWKSKAARRDASVVMVVPIRNESKHLRQCLESIRCQSFEDFVVVVSDNASDDNSASIAGEFCRADDRFTLISQPENRGAADNFGQCVVRATAPYIGFVGGHDVLARDYLARHVAALHASPAASLSFTLWEYIDEAGIVTGQVERRSQPGDWPRLSCPWQRIVASVRNHSIGSGLWNGLFRRQHIPSPPYPAVAGCDHLILTKVLFKGLALEQPGHLYQERNFVKKPTSYMERITGQRGARPSVISLYREYMTWYDSLPDCHGKLVNRAAFRRAVIRKCALMTQLWGHVNGARGLFGLPPVR